MTNETDTDTIVAIATAAGEGGVGIVRLSGPRARAIGEGICARALRPRSARHVRFVDAAGAALDDGIALWFPAPRSYTGEDVVELQAHGSPVMLRQLAARACGLGARHARPGEFSERAFLNGKLDLTQAEAVADLIAAGDLRAARAARRALDGEFSRRVEAIAAGLMRARVHVEAAIDFADEPIETLGGAALRAGLAGTQALLQALLREAEHGRKLRDGQHVVIVGPPNAGKSSLLNALAGADRAIVAEVAGTTRDVLRETIRLDGIELTLVDTAGLREDGDAIEREGMRRARAELERADLALVVLDARDPAAGRAAVAVDIAAVPRRLWVRNKIDLVAVLPAHGNAAPALGREGGADARPGGEGVEDVEDLQSEGVAVSATQGWGLEDLRTLLSERLLGTPASGEGEFSARARHVEALLRTCTRMDAALGELDADRLELAAEELRLAHESLGEITGKVVADDVLGRIFSTFCIGK